MLRTDVRFTVSVFFEIPSSKREDHPQCGADRCATYSDKVLMIDARNI